MNRRTILKMFGAGLIPGYQGTATRATTVEIAGDRFRINFDFRMKGEGFEEGYQSVPVNWGISSARKRGFFNLVAEMTGGAGAR
jgi:hypothetical protein